MTLILPQLFYYVLWRVSSARSILSPRTNLVHPHNGPNLEDETLYLCRNARHWSATSRTPGRGRINLNLPLPQQLSQNSGSSGRKNAACSPLKCVWAPGLLRVNNSEWRQEKENNKIELNLSHSCGGRDKKSHANNRNSRYRVKCLYCSYLTENI